MSLDLPAISDDFMRQALPNTRGYTVVLLRKGPSYDPPRTDPMIWEHGRRNFQLRAAGLLSIVCPIRDDTEMAGIGILNAERPEAERIMAGDPAVQAGVLIFEIHPARSFPGDCLPASSSQPPRSE